MEDNFNSKNDARMAESNQNGADVNGQSQIYGAVYRPDSMSGEYRFTSYSSNPGTVSRPAPAEAQKPAKTQGRRGGVALVVAITAAVLAVITMLFLCCAGLMILSKRFVFRTDGVETQPQSQSADPEETKEANFQVSDRTSSPVSTTAVSIGEQMSIAGVVAAVKDSVVEITTETVTGGSGIYSQYVLSGAGSGVIISDTGMVITNHHVIDGATKITVRLTDGTEFDAKVIGSDLDADIAVVSIKPGDKKLTSAVIGNSDTLVVGEEIVVIGNPLGELGGTVTNGIISATEREIMIEESGSMTLLQTNAAVNPGNSGGGMFNLYGELVGIVNAKSSGDNIEGIGFAIPSNTAKDVAGQLIEYGYVKGRPTIGISYVDVNNSLYARYYFNSSSVGVYIVDDTGKHGFKYGDRIISFNGEEVSSSSDLASMLKKCSVGDTVEIVVMRSGSSVTVSVTLTEKVPE